MADHLQRLKEELELFADHNVTVSVSRKDLIQLIKECEHHRQQVEEMKEQ